MTGTDGLTLPVEAENLIPQAPPMRLIDRLVAHGEGAGTVEVRVPEDSILAAPDGSLDGLAMVEMMAQSYAAVKGYSDRIEGHPVRRGLLVGMNRVRVLEEPSVGDLLRIEVETAGSFDRFVIAEGKVWRGETPLAEASIKLWHL